MGGLSLISENDELKSFDSRVPTEFMPQPRRSFHQNPSLTSKYAKSRKCLSVEGDSLGFLNSTGPVDQPPPHYRRSCHRNTPVTSSYSNSRVSIESHSSFHHNPPLTSSFSNFRECVDGDSYKLIDSKVSIQNPPLNSSLLNSGACIDENLPKRLDSRGSVESLPEPRRSFHLNLRLTPFFIKSRKSLSVEQIEPVLESSRSDRPSISSELSYDKLGLVTVEDDDMEDMCDSRVLTERSSHHRRSFHRLSMSSVLSCVSSRSNLYYDKLAQLPIRLTITKLDGSSFDVEVMKNATVADLKQAIENMFIRLPIEEAPMISWQHVWGSFCLSCGGFKLLDDGENLREYGMKDGDKLHFIRHTSITKDHTKKQTRKRIDASKPYTITEELQVEEDHVDSENFPVMQELEGNSSQQRQSVLHRLFRGLFVYSQVSSGRQFTYKGTRTTRSSRGFVGCFRSTKDRSESSKALRLENFE